MNIMILEKAWQLNFYQQMEYTWQEKKMIPTFPLSTDRLDIKTHTHTQKRKSSLTSKMAGISTVSLLQANSIPKFSREKSELTQKRDFVNGNSNSILLKFGMMSTTRLRAGLSQVEPDLNEDPKDRWATNGIDEVFKYLLISNLFLIDFVVSRFLLVD